MDKGTGFYVKLWSCLFKSIYDDNLNLRQYADTIVVHLGKSVESEREYYDEEFDGWCVGFLKGVYSSG